MKSKSRKFLTEQFKIFLHPADTPASNKIGIQLAFT